MEQKAPKVKNMDVLRQLAYLEKPVLHDTFDFSVINVNRDTDRYKTVVLENYVVHSCGSAGCLLGELPAFSKDFTFDKSGLLYKGKGKPSFVADGVSDYFNIDSCLFMFMFFGEIRIPPELKGAGVIEFLKETATLEEVQHNLRIIINKLEDGTLDKYILPDVTDNDADKSTISESDL
jgi:hypothetical protein